MSPEEPTPAPMPEPARRMRAPRAGAAPDEAAAVRRVRAGELLGPRRELVIEHGGREYRLRITRHDRLILTA